jgi:hypothetical protein
MPLAIEHESAKSNRQLTSQPDPLLSQCGISRH